MKPEMSRIHGSGTYDHQNRTWLLRTKTERVRMTVNALAKHFNTPLPNDERATRPYWTRYLAEVQILKMGGNEVLGEFQRIRAREVQHLETIRTTGDSLKNEIATYVERKKKETKGGAETALALDIFVRAAGDITLQQINVNHYRRFLELLKDSEVGERTKYNRQSIVNTFLKRVENDYDLRFSFLRNPDYRRSEPQGSKVQYTLEQVKTALQNATGINRMSLLLALNAGFYWGDIAELTEDDIKDGRIEKVRAKNKKKATKFVGSWKLWKETSEALQLGKSRSKLMTEWNELRAETGIPEHKAIRKAVCQWIQDHCGEDAARLFRGENGAGVHHKFYVKFSDEQKAKLDKALEWLKGYIGL